MGGGAFRKSKDMAVPVGERGVTSKAFMKAAEKLHDDIMNLLLRDFGCRPVNRNLKTFAYHAKFTPEDKDMFIKLCEKYHIDIESEYPAWIIDYYRTSILKIMDDMMHNLRLGYTMYIDVKQPNAMNEYKLKREALWRAIADGYELLGKMQAVIRQLPVDASKYMSYTDRIVKEIELIKDRKRLDNSIAYMIQEYQKQREKKGS